GLDQIVGVGGAQVTCANQRTQGLAGAAQPQRRIASAENQLLGLDEKLDFADAASPQLHVVAEDFHGAAAAIGIDLAFDRMDVVDGREVQVLAPDVRRQLVEEGSPDGNIPGYGMGL